MTCAYTIFFISLKKKVNQQLKDKAGISGQRERIESQLYELSEIMLSDTERLFDNTKLLLQFENKDLSSDYPIPNYMFFQNLGIDIANISIKDKTVFCLMPFHKRFQKTYDVIKMTCKTAEYECLRSDIPYCPGNILRQIVQMLLSSQLIIAILDGKNPNVFYEIGIAHSIGKPVILIANLNQKEEIPFDLKSDRLLLYSGYSDLNTKLLSVLKHIHHAR